MVLYKRRSRKSIGRDEKMTEHEIERERLIELLRQAGVTWFPTKVADYLIENGVRCMPFIAMIEQTTENGKFCKKPSEQKFNGRYCLVYENKAKWGTPLIDICGTKTYNTEEAEQALEEKNG